MDNETIALDIQKSNHAVLIDKAWLVARGNAGSRAYLLHKDSLYRIGNYASWLDDNGYSWTTPRLADYRDYLLHNRTVTNKRGKRVKKPLANATVKAHLSTIRARIRDIVASNETRQALYALVDDDDLTPSDKKALVDEMLTRIENDLMPSKSKVTTIKKQDTDDNEHIRLSSAQARQYIKAVGLKSKKAIRDTAIRALILCTGIREAELCNLKVDDLRVELGGELALRITAGKGSKQRIIPYGEMSWCLLFTDRWLAVSGIKKGFVFRGFVGRGDKLSDKPLTTRAIIKYASETMTIKGDVRTVKPHDLRRTYARLQYDNGMDVVSIQQNLGHVDIKTTLGYIGTLDANKRRGKSVIDNPYSASDLQKRWTLK